MMGRKQIEAGQGVAAGDDAALCIEEAMMAHVLMQV